AATVKLLQTRPKQSGLPPPASNSARSPPRVASLASGLSAGVGLFSVVFVKSFTANQGLAILVGSVLLILVSSVQVGMEVRRRQRLRTASEGARLANRIKYLSRLDPPAP
ncbi:MAG: hypothetical protein Q8N53_09535, partial [Longimicrobiales bacterium]|nr:hypothetical protein [Longimicrobiales bacterium]